MIGNRRRARLRRVSQCRRPYTWRQPVLMAAPRHRRSDGQCRVCRRCRRRGRRHCQRRLYRRRRHRSPWRGCPTTTRMRRPARKSSSISFPSSTWHGLGRSATPPAGHRSRLCVDVLLPRGPGAPRAWRRHVVSVRVAACTTAAAGVATTPRPPRPRRHVCRPW